MDAERYSFEQIFCGLREAWGSSCKPFAPETSIYRHLKAERAWHDFDAGLEALMLQQFFGFKASEAEWKGFLRFDVPAGPDWERDGFPQIAFGDLARFIAERTPVTAKFEPVTVFGRVCAPAGAFRGLHQLAEQVAKAPQRLGPSTPIHDVLRGWELRQFWNQVRWRTVDAVPPLPEFWRGIVEYVCIAAVFAWIGAFLVGVFLHNLKLPAAVVVGGFVAYRLARWYQRRTNPLPADCLTFRDLACRIAELPPTTT
jgi:hypothetical protein